MTFNNIGKIANICWNDIPNHFPNVQLDELVIMPNHVHGIIKIKNSNIAMQNSPRNIVGAVGANEGAVGAENIPPEQVANAGANAGAKEGAKEGAKDFSPRRRADEGAVGAEDFPPERKTDEGAKDFSPRRKAPFRSPSKTVGSIVRGFKIGVTKWVRENTDIYSVWQRNYYDRIIRDEAELNRIRKYILQNPSKWQDDQYYRY